MRKYLLSTSALAGAALLSSAAVADVSIVVHLSGIMQQEILTLRQMMETSWVMIKKFT